MRRFRWHWLLLVPLFSLGIAHFERAASLSPGDWRVASREPVGLAPDPATTEQAVAQVYAARAVRWRGYFGVHTWIAVKPSRADHYTVYEVTRWQRRRNGTTLSISERAPDARWYGNAPQLVADLRGGPEVDAVIERIDAAAKAYAYAGEYHVWPGPNSNTFTAYVLREVPELKADLPPTAIGKDYLGATLFARTPSGTGVQLNLFGLLGVMAAVEEGVELNVLGMSFGIDPKNLAIKLPFAGELGLRIGTAAAAAEPGQNGEAAGEKAGEDADEAADEDAGEAGQRYDSTAGREFIRATLDR